MNEPDNNQKSECRWLTQWVPGIVLWLLIGAILAGAIYFRPWGRAGGMAYQAICAANLNGIGKGIFLYRDEHNDLPPPNLAAVVADSTISTKMLTCPSSGTERATTAQPADIAAHCDYIYAPLPEDIEKKVVMAFELPANHHQDIVNVLFNDYSVQGIQEMDRFVSLLQKLNDYHAGLRRQKP